MNLKRTTGINRIIRAWFYSLEGLKAAFSNEAAFRQEICLVIIFGPAGFFMGSTPAEKALLILPLFAVLITELLNSALEAVVDRTGSEIHPLSKRAKDMGSAAVFISLVMTCIIWAVILFA